MSTELLKKVRKVSLSEVSENYNYPKGFDHAVIDEHNNILNFCSKKYHLVPNAEIYLPVEEILDNVGLKFNKTVKIIDGSKFYVDYVIKDNSQAAKVGDVFPKISIWNSYDGSMKFRKEFGYFKLVCTNGLTSPLNVFETTKQKHSTSSEFGDESNLKHFLQSFAPSVEQFLINSKKDFNFFGQLHSTPSTIAQLEKLAEEMNFSDKVLSTAIERYKYELSGGFSYTDVNGNSVNHEGSDESLFTVYNALNYAIYNTQVKELPDVKLKKDVKLINLVGELIY